MSRKPRPPVSSSSRPSAPERGRGRRPNRTERSAQNDRPAREERAEFERPARAAAGKSPYGKSPYGKARYGKTASEQPAERKGSGAPAKRPAAAPAKAPAKPPAKAKAEPRFEAHEPQRIAKLLARAGVGSRRDIERMIEDGRIALNGEVLTTPATIVTSLQGVTVDGNPVSEVEPTRLWRFFKPAGCLTTVRDPEGRATIYDLLPKGTPRVVTIGRLDYNTEGLLLLTNNGELKRWLELPSNAVERIYRARVRGRIDYTALADLIEGITIDGVRYGSINAEVESSHGMTHWIAVKISEGKNREVRNVLGHLGLQVSRLIRTDYGPFTVDGLREGDIQEISPGSIPGVPGELLPPAGFEIENPYPYRREELFATRRPRRETEEVAAPKEPREDRTREGGRGRDRRDEGPRRRAPEGKPQRGASYRDRDAAPEVEAVAEEPVRPFRRLTRAAEARGGAPAPKTGTPELRADTKKGTDSRKPGGRKPVSGTLSASGRPAAGETAETGRKKLERKAGWAKPKPKGNTKPRSGSKGGRKK
ncbi:MAG TPA: pseudouridine synthase [Pedomonas sp.]|uniref:pseudouridine synthase n=1 Tax=Pedomonas sp. TaxID=2976421 RepID=UPI002F42968F